MDASRPRIPGKKVALAASFLFVFLAMLYFIWLSPLMSDNFVFSREITPGYAEFYTGAKVEARPLTLAGAVRQACEMYGTWCGRFAGNLAVYLLFMLPRWLYCLLAACGFALYTWLLQMCVFGRAWRENLTPGWILGIAALLWLGLPSFGEAFFWLSVGGEIALLAQAAILLPYRFALDDIREPEGKLAFLTACAAMLAGGLLAASLDYPASASLPPTALACTAWLWIKKRKAPIMLICGALGLCLGACLTLAAPGNAARIILTRDPSVHAYMSASWSERILSWLAHLPGAVLMEWVPLLLLGTALYALWREYGRKWLKQIPAAAWLFLFPACMIHGAYLFTAWPPPRAFAGSFAMLLVCACIVCVRAKQAPDVRFGKIANLPGLLLGLCCVFSLLWEGVKFYQLHQLVEKREEILTNAKGSAIIPPMPPGSGDRYWVLGKYLYDLSNDPTFWINRAMAAHYRLEQVKAAGNAPKRWAGGPKSSPVEMESDGGRLKVRMIGDAPAKLHFYYYGEPAILCALPAGKKIFDWLAADNGQRIKRWLVPILLARADVTPKGDPDRPKRGDSANLKLYSDDMFWLVRPGAGATSFDLAPMEKISPSRESP